ncbi:zinc finger matrin-type protein [Blastocystis sp. ATCC 50177/Nand II]|uniref:Zinc finger matrin-type protein n=1 Tax=Blastocystis sp. subtype 1 (strain ATCC 50177 / NandII) TaxID=478820 RepID=A0A196SAC0_BLAHN|nr:zinc finger matrin-type protein [Blastocystis sp. ATCC 50177/Nand II]
MSTVENGSSRDDAPKSASGPSASMKRTAAPTEESAPEKKSHTTYYSPDGTERKFISARDRKLDLDREIGKVKVITDSSKESEAGGYWCDVCKCSLKDSKAWLDHINGRKHQHHLGNVVRVEHVTVSDVKKKFESLKKGTTKVSAKDLYLKEREERLKKQQEEEEKKEDEEDEETRKLKEMMGFGGFGSAKKKWTVFSQTGATRVEWT